MGCVQWLTRELQSEVLASFQLVVGGSLGHPWFVDTFLQSQGILPCDFMPPPLSLFTFMSKFPSYKDARYWLGSS
jgi:hypothetical protein